MKKEQIELMVEKQKAIENRKKVVDKLNNMLSYSKNSAYTIGSFDITIRDNVSISSVSDREEFGEQLEFLIAYHKVKLEEQIKEIDTYILSRTIE